MKPDINDPKFKELAAAILQRHERGELEANITSAVRDFLIETQLAKSGVIDEEIPPSDDPRHAHAQRRLHHPMPTPYASAWKSSPNG